FPERMHINVLNAVYYLSTLENAMAFADLAEKEIAEWGTTSGLGMTDRTREILDDLIARHELRGPTGRAAAALNDSVEAADESAAAGESAAAATDAADGAVSAIDEVFLNMIVTPSAAERDAVAVDAG